MVIKQMLLEPNKYSRPQTKLTVVTKIVVHYVGNPSTTAVANRNYFNNLKDTHARYVSSHFIIGLGGEIIQCVPNDEVAYCSNQANSYSVSIECCHPDSSGKFNSATEQSLVELCAYLCKQFSLTADDIIRHYDVTGKQCPLYWSPTKYQSVAVANARFNAFKAQVKYTLSCGEADEADDNAVPSVPFKVQVIDTALNIRCAPGVQNKAVGIIKGKGVYTIVQVAQVGSAVWGRLKSGAGWINVGDKYVKKI